MRVVPERPRLPDPESVDVVTADRDGVLRHAGDPVLGIGHVDPVPVDRDSFLDVLVPQVDLDEVAGVNAQLGAGDLTVERQRVDRLAGREPHSGVLRGQREAVVGHARRRSGQARDADDPRRARRRRPAVVRAAVLHDAVRAGKPAVPPRPRDQRGDDEDCCDRGDDSTPARQGHAAENMQSTGCELDQRAPLGGETLHEVALHFTSGQAAATRCR